MAKVTIAANGKELQDAAAGMTLAEISQEWQQWAAEKASRSFEYVSEHQIVYRDPDSAMVLTAWADEPINLNEFSFQVLEMG